MPAMMATAGLLSSMQRAEVILRNDDVPDFAALFALTKCGIQLNWDYAARTVDLSVSN